MEVGGQNPVHDAVAGIGRILDRPPVVVGEPFRDAVRVTGRWGHGALHDSLASLPEHVVMTYYGVDRDIVWRTGGRRLASRTRAGSITLIPEGHDGRWDIGGSIEVSHVYLPDHRLQAAAAQLTGGRSVELVQRVGFEDAGAARILELLGREVPCRDPSSRLFVDQAIDLLCIQLVRAHSSFGALAIEAPRGGLADWQVRRVTEYMHEHIGWLMILRIEEARRHLSDRALAVTDIALMVGYQTPSAFAAAFRKVAGMTPSEYRRQLS